MRLEAYREAHGHCNVPRSWKDEDGFALGAWVSNQRSQHKKYAKAPSSSRLTAERVAALERVGAIASWASYQPQRGGGRRDEEGWSRAASRLQAYREAHGHCNVPCSWKDEDGFALGAWVSRQKSEHKKYEEEPSSSSLTAERVEDLVRVGAIFDWLEAEMKRHAPDVHREFEAELMAL